MSSIVSRRPSVRNQSKDSRWISIRLGRSRTCLRRENDLRARGAVTVLAKKNSLPYWLRNEGEAEKRACESRWCPDVGATLHDSGGCPPAASTRRGPVGPTWDKA